jgi:hypothetical protein
MSIAVEHGRFQLTANNKRKRSLSIVIDSVKPFSIGGIPSGGNF